MAGFNIKASEAARRIGVSLVTAKRMINDGRLIGEKVGSRWQVSEQSVFWLFGEDEAEVNKSEEEVNKTDVVAEFRPGRVPWIQNPLLAKQVQYLRLAQ